MSTPCRAGVWPGSLPGQAALGAGTTLPRVPVSKEPALAALWRGGVLRGRSCVLVIGGGPLIGCRVTSRLWVAPLPLMPSADKWPPATIVQQNPGRSAKVWLGLFLVGAAVLISLPVSNAPAEAYSVTLLAPLGLHQILAARRSFVAVGPGWLAVRAEAFGQGSRSRVSDLAVVKVWRPSRGPDLLIIKARDGSTFRFGLGDANRVTDLRKELARQVLASPVQISPDAGEHLRCWVE
jgi:hypothetical protein